MEEEVEVFAITEIARQVEDRFMEVQRKPVRPSRLVAHFADGTLTIIASAVMALYTIGIANLNDWVAIPIIAATFLFFRPFGFVRWCRLRRLRRRERDYYKLVEKGEIIVLPEWVGDLWDAVCTDAGFAEDDPRVFLDNFVGIIQEAKRSVSQKSPGVSLGFTRYALRKKMQAAIAPLITG